MSAPLAFLQWRTMAQTGCAVITGAPKGKTNGALAAPFVFPQRRTMAHGAPAYRGKGFRFFGISAQTQLAAQPSDSGKRH